MLLYTYHRHSPSEGTLEDVHRLTGLLLSFGCITIIRRQSGKPEQHRHVNERLHPIHQSNGYRTENPYIPTCTAAEVFVQHSHQYHYLISSSSWTERPHCRREFTIVIIIFTELSRYNAHIITVMRVFVPIISGDGGLAMGAAVTAGSRHTSPRHIPPAQLQQHRLVEHHGVFLSAHTKQKSTNKHSSLYELFVLSEIKTYLNIILKHMKIHLYLTNLRLAYRWKYLHNYSNYAAIISHSRYSTLEILQLYRFGWYLCIPLPSSTVVCQHICLGQQVSISFMVSSIWPQLKQLRTQSQFSITKQKSSNLWEVGWQEPKEILR